MVYGDPTDGIDRDRDQHRRCEGGRGREGEVRKGEGERGEARRGRGGLEVERQRERSVL